MLPSEISFSPCTISNASELTLEDLQPGAKKRKLIDSNPNECIRKSTDLKLVNIRESNFAMIPQSHAKVMIVKHVGNKARVFKKANHFPHILRIRKLQKSIFEATKKKAEDGNTDAQYRVAQMFRYGIGVTQSVKKAYKFFEFAVMHRNIFALAARDAMISHHHSNYRRLMTITQPDAFRKLANIHKKIAGNNFPTEAFTLLHLAAGGYNDPVAKIELAKMYASKPYMWCKKGAAHLVYSSADPFYPISGPPKDFKGRSQTI